MRNFINIIWFLKNLLCQYFKPILTIKELILNPLIKAPSLAIFISRPVRPKWFACGAGRPQNFNRLWAPHRPLGAVFAVNLSGAPVHSYKVVVGPRIERERDSERKSLMRSSHYISSVTNWNAPFVRQQRSSTGISIMMRFVMTECFHGPTIDGDRPDHTKNDLLSAFQRLMMWLV